MIFSRTEAWHFLNGALCARNSCLCNGAHTPHPTVGRPVLLFVSLLLFNLSKKVRTGVSNPSPHGLHTSAVTNRDNALLWLGGSFIIPQIKNVNLFCVFFLFGRFFFYFSLFIFSTSWTFLDLSNICFEPFLNPWTFLKFNENFEIPWIF